MKIKWLGHSAFLITSESGVRIITDPYKSGDDLKYAPVTESADVVTVSHEHYDHNFTSSVQGNPQIYRGPEPIEIKGIKFSALSVFHDNEQGKLRSKNTVVCIDVDGMRLCHLGDLGHILDAVQLNKLGKVDVLFIPVGGLWAIDAAEATKVVETVNPKVVIPMHYKNERCTFPIAPVTDFLKDKKNVTKIDGSEVEYKVGTLPPTTQIVVLKPAL